MNQFAKTIQIFLPNGNPRGIKIAEVTNRTVQAILIPRNQMEEIKNREEIHQVGLYFLFGQNEEKARPEVYIGEAENCYERLKQHHKQKDFWKTAVIVVTNNKQNQFTKSDVKFLENYSFEKCNEIGRFTTNQTIPTKSFVPEWRQADLFDIFDTIKLLLSTLGYPVFNPLRNESNQKGSNEEDMFYLNSRGVKAKGQLTNDGFVVFKDSESTLEPTPNFVEKSQNYIQRIEKMVKEGVLIKQDNKYIFQSDFLFNSPSTASTIIIQRASNGWTEWKDKNGQTLHERKRK